MNDEILMKCKNKECENCFACKNGYCNALTTPCDTIEGYCKFYQDKTSYMIKIERLAKLKGLPVDTFVKQNELKEIVDNCKQ